MSLSVIDILPPVLLKEYRRLVQILQCDLVQNLLVYEEIQGSGMEEILTSLQYEINEYDCRQIFSDTSGATAAKLNQIFETSTCPQGGLILLRNVHVLAKNRDGQIDHRVLLCLEDILKTKHPFKVIGTVTAKKSAIDHRLVHLFDQHMEVLTQMEAKERREILHWLLQKQPQFCADSKDLGQLAEQTAGLQYQDLVAVIQQSTMLALEKYPGFDR